MWKAQLWLGFFCGQNQVFVLGCLELLIDIFEDDIFVFLK